MIKRKDLEAIGVEKELKSGYGLTHNLDGKYVKRWIMTKDGRVWITSPRGGYRLAGSKTPPKGF